MTVPVLRGLVSQHPEVKITFISRPFYRPFFEGIPNVAFFSFDEKQRHKGFLGLIRLFGDLKRLDIDAFADLHNVLRSQVIRNLFSLSGTRVAAVDKGRAEKAALTRAENKVFVQLPTMFERHAKVFETLGFGINLSDPAFAPKLKMNRAVGELAGQKNCKWIGIAPFAQYESKVYPLDLMGKVVDALAEHADYRIFLFGGGNQERELLDGLADERGNVVNVVGKIGFGEELALISNLDLMVSMDSGNAHIAAMYGVKVVTLWGATHPFLGFGAFAQAAGNSLISDLKKFPKLPSSVYGNKIIVGYEDVMRSILTEDVIEKVEALIGND